ncbi:MAG: EamA family transporter [Clostridiales bacterium]|nr:EamA family transporter [Clostridiales bacterium]
MKKRFGIEGNLIILATALLWSTGGVLIKFIPWSSLSIASIRGLISVTILLLIRLLRRCGGKAQPVRFTRYNVAAGAAMFSTSALFLAANKLTTAANAIVLQYIAPILVLLYTALVQKRKPTKAEILLTVLVFFGCALAFSDKFGGSNLLGDSLAVLSGFTFAALILLSRHEQTQAEDGQIIGCGMSFIFCLPFLLTDTTLSFTPANVGAMLALGLLQYTLPSILFAKGVKMTHPVAASVILTAEPIMNPVWVFLFLHELPGPRAIVGFVLVISAVTLQSLIPILRKPKPGYVEPVE